MVDANRHLRRLISLARWAFPEVWTASAGSLPVPTAQRWAVRAARRALSWVRNGRPWYATGPRNDQLRATQAAAETVGSGVVRLAVSRGAAYIVLSQHRVEGALGRPVLLRSQLAYWHAVVALLRLEPVRDHGDPGRCHVFVGVAKSLAVLVRSQER